MSPLTMYRVYGEAMPLACQSHWRKGPQNRAAVYLGEAVAQLQWEGMVMGSSGSVRLSSVAGVHCCENSLAAIMV